MLHREGTKIILNSLFLMILLNVIAVYSTDIKWVHTVVLITTSIFMILVVQFFRNPKRTTPTSELDEIMIAPADGKVVIIEEVEETEYFKDKRIQVSIFMSPLNVHVNKYPINGEVTYSKYHPGQYLVAYHPKSSTLNERTTVVTKHPKYGEILFRQVAGLLARRIVKYAKVGDKAVAGGEFGFIKFGSRIDLYLPLDAEIVCKVGDKTRGAETIIAKFKA